MSRFCVEPALRPENSRIRGEDLIEKESGKIEAYVHTPGDKETVQGVTFGRRDPFAEICNWWKDTQSFSNAGLEVGKFADFIFESRTRYRVVSNMSVDFALDTFVNDGICDNVEEDGANGCRCCIGARKTIGEGCQRREDVKSGTYGMLLQRNGDFQLCLIAIQTVFQKRAEHVIFRPGSLLKSLFHSLAGYLRLGISEISRSTD